MELIYDLGVRVFYVFMYVASIVNNKAKTWINGQNQQVRQNDQNCIWIHCASLGEYKQVQPLVVLLDKSGYEIVFTFFSPSGYDHVKSKHPIYYLPLDTYGNAKRFVEKINPSLAIFVRSEYWFNHIRVLKERDISLVIMNCYLGKDHYFFKGYGKWFLNKLNSVNFFYTINKETSNLLSSKGKFQNLTVGDTKVDQVIHAKAELMPIKLISIERKIILAASIETGDRKLINQLIENNNDQFLLILVPHEHSSTTYEYYKKQAKHNLVKYSELTRSHPNIIYVDVFGILPSLFRYAWVSYIGGGFDKGIHNILESCIEQRPMIFGPKFKKFREAQSLIKTKAAISIADTNQINTAIDYFNVKTNYDEATLACKNYIATNKGATKSIYDHLKKTELI